MDIFLWILFFLPISKAWKPLKEIKLFGELGGSINIKCPLEIPQQRYYLCREKGKWCSTVVSSSPFVAKDYKDRVSLTPFPEDKVFMVELRNLKEEDNGNYACGTGYRTDRGKTQRVILTVNTEYYPFWDPDYFEALPPPWLWTPIEASSLSTTQATSTSAPRTQPKQTQPPLGPSPTSSVLTHRTTLAATTPSPTSSSSVTTKTLHLDRLPRLFTVSNSHHIRLQGESASYFGSSVKKDGGFHNLILVTLGIFLMMFLGMVLGRLLQKKRALSKRINRLAMRMSALEASQRTHSQLHHSRQRRLPRPVSNRLRSQHNIYSACPRQVQRPTQNGEQTSASSPSITEPSAPPQVSKMAQLQAPVPVMNEYMSTYQLCLAEAEESDSHDYINVSCLTQLPNCSPDLGFCANQACR